MSKLVLMLIELVKMLVQSIAQSLTPEKTREIIDKAFDAIEDKVAESETTLDDALVLPVINALRLALSIPDNDVDAEPETPEVTE